MNQQKPRFAFLGPKGTYTEIALQQYRKASAAVDDIPCYSISEVFQAVDEGRAEAGFVPSENMLQGPVTETLDLLHRYKKNISITDSFVLRIEHVIGRLTSQKSTPASNAQSQASNSSSDTKYFADITEVYSHSQALAQCSTFLRTHLNQAALVPVESTAAAVEHVKNQNLVHAAVIASEVSLHERGFSTLKKDISDRPGNKTRFVVIRKGQHDGMLDSSQNSSTQSFVTSIVIDPGRDRQGLLYEILQIISITHEINLVSIHSRPDARGGFVFHLDLEGTQEDSRIASCLQALETYCYKTTGQTTEISVLGCYPRLPFYEAAFDTVGIIGGKGKMGRWFQRFFEEAGLQTITHDKLDSDSNLRALVERSQVILLSVPLSAVGSVMESLSPLLCEKQLVVENCSIKGEALRDVLAKVPAGVEVLSIHTMFGPETTSIRGQNIVVSKTETSADRAQAFEDLFYKFGGNISTASVLAHDKKVAQVQSLTHLLLLGFAETIRETFNNVDEIDVFSTPNTRALIQAIQRVLSQEDDLLIDIQLRNVEACRARHRFLEILYELVFAFDRDSAQKFLEMVRENRKYFCSSSDGYI